MKTLTIFFLLFHTASVLREEPKVLPAPLGDDVILPCYGPVTAKIILVEWTRPDLGSPEYVFMYRDERPYTSFQHPSFVGRVELRDEQMKDGDVSLILRNVSGTDNGIYECRVSQGGRRREVRANIKAKPVSVINLEVEESGGEEGNPTHIHVGFGAGFALLVVTGVILVGALKIRKSTAIQESASDISEPLRPIQE